MKFFKFKSTDEEVKFAAKKPATKKIIEPDLRVPLTKNTELENYVIGEAIGRGSFSILYLGVNKNTDTEVIIKEYFPKHITKRVENNAVILLDDKRLFTFNEGFRQFFKEAMVLNKISHPHALKTNNIFRANKTAYLVSDNLGGRDLKWFLSSTREQLDQKLIDKVFMPILSALNFLHRTELLHLDIKPANILLQPNGKSLLLDFGAVQSISHHKLINRVQTLTHGFAPPEQYDKHPYLGPWTDIYAVAATLYYSIACKPPTKWKDNDSPVQLNIQKYQDEYRPKFLQAINQSLSFNAKNRHKDVDSFAEALLRGSSWKTLRDYEIQVMSYDRFHVTTTASQLDVASAVT